MMIGSWQLGERPGQGVHSTWPGVRDESKLGRELGMKTQWCRGCGCCRICCRWWHARCPRWDWATAKVLVKHPAAGRSHAMLWLSLWSIQTYKFHSSYALWVNFDRSHSLSLHFDVHAASLKLHLQVRPRECHCIQTGHTMGHFSSLHNPSTKVPRQLLDFRPKWRQPPHQSQQLDVWQLRDRSSLAALFHSQLDQGK